jgi:hypothetical protein
MVNIRDWAKKKGINENDIVYDAATKRIKVKGVDYGKGTPTYTKQMTANRPSDMTTYYAPNTVQSGTKFDEEVLDDTFDRGNLLDATKKQQTAQNNYMNTLTKGYTPGVFKYDQKKDSAYQSAITNAQQNIRNAQTQNLGDMQRRGLLNSSIATDRANQISADEMARVDTQIAPQLEERAYNRFMQSENMNRNKWQDDVQRLAALLGVTKEGTASMQGIVDRSTQQRQAIADSLSKTYGTVVKPTVDSDSMYSQVKGMKTAAQREAERKQQEILTERNYKSTEEDKKRKFTSDENEKDRAAKAAIEKAAAAERAAIAKAAAAERAAERAAKASERAAERAAKAAAAKAASSSSGSSGGTSSGKTPKAPVSTVANVIKDIDGAGVVVQNVKVLDPSTGSEYVQRQVANKQGLIDAINSYDLSATDRQKVLRNYGLTKEADSINNDKFLRTSKTNPVEIIKMIINSSLTDEDRDRKLVYYGLYDKFIEETN